MKTIPGPLQAHLDGDTTTLALCWVILKRNGDFIRGTTHDRDVTVASGTYVGTYKASSNITPSNVKSNSDLAVDNLDVTGALSDDGTLRIDITQADIEARNLDFASVRTFFVNWTDPGMGQVPMRSGFLGQIGYDSNHAYKTEVRGLAQLLQQNIIQTYSDRCTVKRFGDARCTVDVAALSITATVTTVVSRREFTVSGITQPDGYFSLGNLVGLTGLNIGFLRQIRIDNVSSVEGHLSLYGPFPEDVVPGDTFTMSPGCDRLLSTCLNKYNNLENNRAYGVLIPGIDLLLAGPAGQMSTP